MSKTPANSFRRAARVASLAVILAVVAAPGTAWASHIQASSLVLSDTAVGATATYTITYQVGAGNGNLAAGQPKLNIIFPDGTDLAGVGFDVTASGICACTVGTLDGTFAAFPAYATGGGFTVASSTRTVTIGPLDVATTNGQTAFRVVLTGVVNRTTEGSTALTAQVTNASDNINTAGAVSFTLTGASAATGAADPIGATTATLAGTATAPAGVTVSRRGIVLAPASEAVPQVDTAGSVTIDAAAAGTGAFQVLATGLEPEEEYRFRAFIVTVGGTQYGLSTTFATTAAPPPVVNQAADPRAYPVAVAVEQAAGLEGTGSVLVRGAAPVPLTTAISPSAGPRGGLVIEDEDRSLRVTVATAAGVSRTAGVVVPVGGEVVCEICAQLAAGSVVEAWIYSAPRLSAAVQVEMNAAEGTCPLLRIPTGAPLDGGGAIEPGVHTLQLRMDTDAGFEILSVPITIGSGTAGSTGVTGGPVPTRVNAGGGPVPILPLGLGLLAVAAGLLLIQRERDLAAAYAWASRPRRPRPVPRRRLTGFDERAQRLESFRQDQRR